MVDTPTLNRAARRTAKQAQARRWASMNEAADYAGVGLRTLREWITQGKITGYRMNARLIRVDLNEVDAAFQPFGGAV